MRRIFYRFGAHQYVATFSMLLFFNAFGSEACAREVVLSKSELECIEQNLSSYVSPERGNVYIFSGSCPRVITSILDTPIGPIMQSGPPGPTDAPNGQGVVALNSAEIRCVTNMFRDLRARSTNLSATIRFNLARCVQN